MQKILLRSDFEALAAARGRCLSLYLPCHPTGREGVGDALRLKQLLQEAEGLWRHAGWPAAQVAALFAPLYGLPGSQEWAKRGRSLVLFKSHEHTRYLPFESSVAEELWVDHRFHVRQLLPRVIDSDVFFVFALSEHHTQLYRGTSTELLPLELPGLPRSLEEALQIDAVDRVMQSHPGAASGPAKRAGVFHGHGGKPDAAKPERSQYVQQVTAVVDRFLHDQTAPLLLAMVGELVPLWRRWSSYSFTFPTALLGDCDYESPHTLQQKAWPLAEQALRQQECDRRSRVLEASGSPRGLSGLQAVLPAAQAGQIDTLLRAALRLQLIVLSLFPSAHGSPSLDGASGWTRVGRAANISCQRPIHGPISLSHIR